MILFLKFSLAYAIPDVPMWVTEKKARLEFLRREALKVSFALCHYMDKITANSKDTELAFVK